MTENEILDLFEKYLESKGYSSQTPSGNRSTTADYARSRIPFVLRQEGISIQTLMNSINKYICDYSIGGKKAHLGETSHNAVINALKRFKEFLDFKKMR